MPTTHHRYKVSFAPDEKTQVEAKADQLRLSVSEFLRSLALGYRVPDPNEFAAAQAIGELLKINADQARLGNLLKLTLDVGDEDLSPATIASINDLVADIRRTQKTIRAGVASLHYELHPRRRRA
jgi:hypothetical protein